jgi:hypothetical protein
MIAFAELLERLVFTPSRNAKVALLRRYFATQPDPDRGIGLAAITGELSFAAAKPGLIRELAATRTDPVLFAWSYDYVGDLAETVALMWPARSTNAPTPRLAEVVDALETAPKAALPDIVAGWLDASDPSVRLALLKLITGGLRVGASARLARSRSPKSAAWTQTMWRRCGTACATVSRAVRMAGKAWPRGPIPRRPGVPSTDVGASARGRGHCRARTAGLARRVEMGRHPRAACFDGRWQAAPFAWRGGHLRCVPGNP